MRIIMFLVGLLMIAMIFNKVQLINIMTIILVAYLAGLLFVIFVKIFKYKSFKKIDLDQVDVMDGFDFEAYVAGIYRALGYDACKTPDSGDFGADVIARKDNQTLAIQCKRYNAPVGIKAVQEVVGSLKYYNATKGIVITNSTFTFAAMTLAKVNDIDLIDREGLEKMIRHVTQ